MRQAQTSFRWLALLLLLVVVGAGGVQAQDGGELDLKQLAIEQIAEYGPAVQEAMAARYFEAKGAQLGWLGLLVLILLPSGGFFWFLLYPIFAGQTIRQRLPWVTTGRLLPLYALQGTIAMIILFVLGFFVWLIQFWLASFSNITNPQFVLQNGAMSYIVDNREDLVQRFTPIFTRVGEDLTTNPDSSVISLLIDNGREMRDDPLLHGMANLINLLWPLLSNLFLVAFSILLFSFLRRIWPELKRMLVQPLELLAAAGPPQRQGFHPPPGQAPPRFPGFAPGQPVAQPAHRPPGAVMWAAGRRLIGIEAKVFLAFSVTAYLLAVLMGVVLLLFLYPIISLLIELTATAMLYFVSFEGGSAGISLSLLLLLIFLVECVVLFIAVFILLLRKVSQSLRQRFTKNIAWAEVLRQLRRHALRFSWVTGLAAVLGIVLSVVGQFVLGSMISGDDPWWFAGLISVPLILLVGLNLGMWFGRGFTMIRAMI